MAEPAAAIDEANARKAAKEAAVANAAAPPKKVDPEDDMRATISATPSGLTKAPALVQKRGVRCSARVANAPRAPRPLSSVRINKRLRAARPAEARRRCCTSVVN